MNTTTPIIQALQITPLKYTNFRENEYFFYCTLLADRYHLAAKDLYANHYLRNYYGNMWQIHVEGRAWLELADYITTSIITADELTGFLYDYAQDIHAMYPKSLLREMTEEAKNTQKHPQT